MSRQHRARQILGTAPWLIILWLAVLALRAASRDLGAGDAPPPEAAPLAPAAAAAAPTAARTAAKVLDDAELVLGPSAAGFDAAGFLAARGGALAGHREVVGGVERDAAAIVQRVAEDHSVSPHVLLTTLELAGGLVDGGDPAALGAPLGERVAAAAGPGLQPALTWLATTLNAAFYAMRRDGTATVSLPHGGTWTAVGPGGAGHAAVAAALAQLDGTDDLAARLAEFAALHAHWFGPLRAAPPAASFPPLLVPWAEGETWHFTGGPHASWGDGTPLGAVDFAPPSPSGCAVAPERVVASAPGIVAVSRDGYVLLDLDGDGYAGTGPVVQYLHLADAGRVPAGTRVAAGDPLGHPSCEGGFATGSHVHVARRLDGAWLPVEDDAQPLTLSGWRFDGGLRPYDGRMTHDSLGARSALLRRNGEATGVPSDNGPLRRAELAAGWALAAAPRQAEDAPPPGRTPGAEIILAALAAPAAGVSPGPGAAVAAGPVGRPLDAIAGAGGMAGGEPDGAPVAPGATGEPGATTATAAMTATLTFRMRLEGRRSHDASFVVAVTAADGSVTPLVGHTDALGNSIALALPPGLSGVFDLAVRVPGFLEARAIGVPLGAGPIEVDLTAGGIVALRPGDLDGDGAIGAADVLAWASATRRGLPAADLDGDGRPGPADLWRVLANVGTHR